MQFGSDHKAIISTLTELEARVFLEFLTNEQSRHQRECDLCLDTINSCDRKDPYQNARALFESSAIARHFEDIRDTKRIIEQVKRQFGWR